jgi:uncharacterized membrane protein HdeD (DUF308 family)
MLTPPLLSGVMRNWWLFVIRGIAAIVFGILAVVLPDITIRALVILFGAFALVDGVGSLVSASRHRGDARHRMSNVSEGVAGVVIGIISLVFPGITALAVIILIGIWAILTGAAEVAAAIRLRQLIDNEWWLVASGVISILAGIIILARPGAGAFAIAIVIGVYAILFGIVLVALGLRLRRMWQARQGQV